MDIEFSGTLCEQAREDRMQRINNIFVYLVAFCLLATVAVIVTCFVMSAYYLLIIFVPLLTLFAVLIFLMYRPDKQARLFYSSYLTEPFTITISNGVITNSYFEKSRLVSGGKSVNSVKRVLDVGEWYYIIFKFGDISTSWVCQKDLLTKGTIEDFENLFENKLVRK